MYNKKIIQSKTEIYTTNKFVLVNIFGSFKTITDAIYVNYLLKSYTRYYHARKYKWNFFQYSTSIRFMNLFETVIESWAVNAVAYWVIKDKKKIGKQSELSVE